MREPP